MIKFTKKKEEKERKLTSLNVLFSSLRKLFNFLNLVIRFKEDFSFSKKKQDFYTFCM